MYIFMVGLEEKPNLPESDQYNYWLLRIRATD